MHIEVSYTLFGLKEAVPIVFRWLYEQNWTIDLITLNGCEQLVLRERGFPKMSLYSSMLYPFLNSFWKAENLVWFGFGFSCCCFCFYSSLILVLFLKEQTPSPTNGSYWTFTFEWKIIKRQQQQKRLGISDAWIPSTWKVEMGDQEFTAWIKWDPCLKW